MSNLKFSAVLGTMSANNSNFIRPISYKKGDTVASNWSVLLLSCAKSHMLSASRRQPHLLHVSAVDRRQTWSMDKS